MTYSPEEKQQLIKYAKTAISLSPVTEDSLRAFRSGAEADHKTVAKFCFDLAETMIDEQRKRFGK